MGRKGAVSLLIENDCVVFAGFRGDTWITFVHNA